MSCWVPLRFSRMCIFDARRGISLGLEGIQTVLRSDLMLSPHSKAKETFRDKFKDEDAKLDEHAESWRFIRQMRRGASVANAPVCSIAFY